MFQCRHVFLFLHFHFQTHLFGLYFFYFKSHTKTQKHKKTNKKKNRYRQIEKRKSKIRRQCDSFSLILDDGDRVTVNKRPHVDAFMKALQGPEFEPHVFTAALASYASPVMDKLEADQGRQLFARRMYRDSCTPTGMGTFAKDLDTLYGDLSRVVLVDNNPISLMKQPSNGILVPSFFDDPNDDVLPTVLDFLRSLAEAPDVRPVLRALKSDS